jgi:hypothetical protein
MLMELLLAGAVATPEPVLVRPDERAAYQPLLDETAYAAFRMFQGDCKDVVAQHVSTTPIRIGDRPDLAAATVRVKVTGCGRSAVENLHVVRMGGAPPWKMVFGLPGESNASFPLQQSSLQQAAVAAHVDLPAGCKGQRLDDVYVTAWPHNILFPKPGEQAPPPAARGGRPVANLPPQLEAERDKLDLDGAWSEYWPLAFCGQDRSLIITFIPLREGGNSVFFAAPVWKIIAERGPGARPARAPRPPDQTPPPAR